ncbi:hypothetical protein [Euzebya tangerina]|uniref:hypothetical protein n=1 Tax=Euzebya tangerina TaxID=591198 RepID=UPI0013C2B4BE|nr:hypothetical protein [Euzebya tangerina]
MDDGLVVATTAAAQTSYIDEDPGPGAHEYEVRAVDGAGNRSPPAIGAVTVPQPPPTSLQLIRAAHDRSDLTDLAAAELALFTTVAPALLPGEFTDATGPTDGDAGIEGLRYLDSVDDDGRRAIVDVLVPVLDTSAGTAPASAWPDCSQPYQTALSRFECVATDGAASGLQQLSAQSSASPDPQFRVFYTVGQTGVPGDDQDGNGRPDLIDLVLAEANRAWTHYVSLGYQEPSKTVEIVMNPLMLPGAGLSLPSLVPGSRPAIYLDTDPNRVGPYLVHHELFHQFQYSYLGLPDLVANFDNGTWWREATAEWAAHQVEKIHPDADVRDANRYATNIRHALSAPEREFDRSTELVGGAEYGSFLVAEFIEDRFGIDAVRETWETLGEAIVPRRPSDVIYDLWETDGAGFDQELHEYREWAYVLTGRLPDGTTNRGLGFDDPDVDLPQDTSWRRELATSGSPTADGSESRPARQTHVVSADRSVSVTKDLRNTGTLYADLELPTGGGTLSIGTSGDLGSLTATLLAFDQYPRLCQNPLAVAVDGSANITVGTSCTMATLVATNTTPTEPFSSASTRFGASISFDQSLGGQTDVIGLDSVRVTSGPDFGRYLTGQSSATMIVDIPYPGLDSEPYLFIMHTDDLQRRASDTFYINGQRRELDLDRSWFYCCNSNDPWNQARNFSYYTFDEVLDGQPSPIRPGRNYITLELNAQNHTQRIRGLQVGWCRFGCPRW